MSAETFYNRFVRKHPVKTISVDGDDMEYLSGGKGKTAFLIFPGAGQDALSCFDLIDAYEDKYKAIAVNYSGFHSLDAFFEYVDIILRVEKIDKVILYGLSLGGLFAQLYVRKYPEKVIRLILSHTSSTLSPTSIKKVSRPFKLAYFFLPIIPMRLFSSYFFRLAAKAQSGNKVIKKLFQKHSTKENMERRAYFLKKAPFNFLDKSYLKTLYKLGAEMEKIEKENFTKEDLISWSGKILILRTDNDPMAQDEGIFEKYYPKAEVVTFHHTGHLTAFIQFEKMKKAIDNFLG